MTNQNYLSIYAKSFNWAGFFLPKQTYQKCSTLYDFCRVIDNIADDKGSVELKENKFKNFENNFNNISYKLLYYILTSMKNIFIKNATYTTRLGNINKEIFAKFNVIVPKPSIMNKYKLQELFDEVDNLKEALENNKKEYQKQLDKLFESFQQNTN